MLEHLFSKLNPPLEPIPTGLKLKLTKLPQIEAVIFDIYGTLVVSGTGDISIAQTIDKENELRSILQSSGMEPGTDTQLTDLFYSLIKEDHAQSKAKGAHFPEVDILEIWKRFLGILKERELSADIPTGEALQELAVQFECAVNPVWPMPGLEAMLRRLREKGIPTGIVSNAQFYTPIMVEGFTGQSLEDLGFQKDLCVWSYQEKLGKPSTELFEKLREALSIRNIATHQALYVGNDMLNDIWTADQAGLRTALFAGDQRSLRLRKTDDRCSHLEPDVILTELGQLLEVI